MVAIRTGAREVLKLEPNDVRFTPESGLCSARAHVR